jgi:catechol 2,3-dioxygenase-like lactoylglutathione lyase family enzyme
MIRIIVLITLFSATQCLHAQTFDNNNNPQKIMKLNAGIVTEKLAETKAFYLNYLNFGVSFENEFYLLLHTANKQYELSFLLPNHPSQQAIFHQAFNGKGMYLTLEVDEIDSIYAKLKKLGLQIKIDLRDEPWGDRHFAIEDPNGIAIDIVKYTPVEQK